MKKLARRRENGMFHLGALSVIGPGVHFSLIRRCSRNLRFDNLPDTFPFEILELVVPEPSFWGGGIFSVTIMHDLEILEVSFLLRQPDLPRIQGGAHFMAHLALATFAEHLAMLFFLNQLDSNTWYGGSRIARVNSCQKLGRNAIVPRFNEMCEIRVE